MKKSSPLQIKNIRLFIAFRVFFNARFYYPVFTIIFLDYGLTIEQFSILNTVWAVTIVCSEVPSGALADLRRALDEIAPQDGDYAHNLRWGDGNGHSHLRAALLGPSLTIPIVDGRLTLGTWQQIVFLDFDVRARQRRLVVQISS